jgi:hypothetical protein
VAQFCDSSGSRVPMVPPDLCRFDELVHDMGRCGLIRVPHPKIDDVFAPMTRLQLQRLDLRKYVRRKPVYAEKSVHASTESVRYAASLSRRPKGLILMQRSEASQF